MNQKAQNWRSLLYVPGNNVRFLAKAQERGADALLIDLEDSVPDDRKAEARQMTAEWIGKLAMGPSDICVRINGGIRQAVADLEAVVLPGLSAVMIAKCETPEKPVMIAEVIAELEAERGLAPGEIALIALIETPDGLAQAREIAKAHERVTALVLGSEDFATTCQMTSTPETLALAKQQIVYAARAAGIIPLGLMDTTANFSPTDLPGLVQRSKQFGFSGATAVHPSIVSALNEGFSPSKEEIGWAKRVLTVIANANQVGLGAARLEGKMIDKPVLLRARSILVQINRPASSRDRP